MYIGNDVVGEESLVVCWDNGGTYWVGWEDPEDSRRLVLVGRFGVLTGDDAMQVRDHPETRVWRALEAREFLENDVNINDELNWYRLYRGFRGGYDD